MNLNTKYLLRHVNGRYLTKYNQLTSDTKEAIQFNSEKLAHDYLWYEASLKEPHAFVIVN